VIDAQTETILIVCLTSVACAIPGVFIVLRGMSTLSNSVNYPVLFGMAAALFFVQSAGSPVIVLMAGLLGAVVIMLTEKILKTGIIKRDAAAAVAAYPFFFSIAVIFIFLFPLQTHTDIEAALLGELAFARFRRLEALGYDLGPVAFWQSGGLALVNIILAVIFYKELKLAVFDYGYAAAAGFTPKRVIYGVVLILSFTSAVSYEITGSVMTAGFIVGPAIIASYFTKDLWKLLFLSPLVGVISCLFGYNTAYLFDTSIAGTIVSVMGGFLLLSFWFAPDTGAIAKVLIKRRAKIELSVNLLLVHLWQHEILGNAAEKNAADAVSPYLNWNSDFTDTVVKQCMDRQLLGLNTKGQFFLLPKGVLMARNVLAR